MRFRDVWIDSVICLRDRAAPVGAVEGWKENFAGQHQRLARQILNSLAQHLFRLTLGVHIGVVKVIHALVVSSFYQLHSALIINLLAKRDPCAQ